jgi:hypothetical protein
VSSGVALWRVNDRATILWHTERMPHENLLTLRQADQARTDFATLEAHLEFLMQQMTRLPTYKQLAKIALLIAFVSAALAIVGIEALWRYFPACGSN